MPPKIPSADDLIRIVSHGGGLDVDLSALKADEVVRIVSFAPSSGASIILRNFTVWSVDELVRIAAIGKGRVIFKDL